VAFTIEDHIQHFAIYQSPNSADAYNDACMAADGSIVRVQVTRGANPLQQSFRWQRVTDPTQTSQWLSWTTFGAAPRTAFRMDCVRWHNIRAAPCAPSS
jgi:hypothetical protein